MLSTPIQYTCESVVNWITTQRRSPGAKKSAWSIRSWDWHSIASDVLSSARVGGFNYVADSAGIYGVVCYTPLTEFKTIWVRQLIADKRALKVFINGWYEKYDGWALVYHRDGRRVILSPRQVNRIFKLWARTT